MDVYVDTTVMMILVILMVPITGFFLAIIPLLMKKSEVFAVTVPEAETNTPYLKKLKRHYVLIVLAATFLVTLLCFVFLLAGNEMGVLVSMILGLLIVCAGSYILMLFYRKKVNVYKAAQDWETPHQESTAVIGESDIPGPVSLKWNLLYFPIFLITALVGYLGYDAMPDQIVMQVGFDGQVNNWVDKSYFIILMPVLIQIFFGICFTFVHWTITRSKKLSNPLAPASSALAYGMFARAQSLYLVAGGLLMTACIIAMPFTFMNVITFMQAIVFIIIACFVLIIGAILISVIYGQGGARVFKRMQESDTLISDDDKYWKLGIFYFNPDDPNWFLPARFSIGWTCNFARPIVWVFTFGLIAVTALFIVSIMFLAGQTF